MLTGNVGRVATYRMVEGFPGYLVGDDGSVWGCRTSQGTVGTRWRRLRPRADKDGYLSVTLYRQASSRTVKVAHLVLAAFVGPRPEGFESCHWPDTNPANNAVGNLRWATHAENSQDKVRGGTVARGERHGSAKLTADDVRAIRSDHAAGRGGYKILGRRYGVSANQIRLIVKRRNWTHVT